MSTPIPQKQKRPASITIVVVLLLLGVVVNFVSGVLFLYGSNLLTEDPTKVEIFSEEDTQHPDALTLQGEFAVEGVIDLILGVVQLVITIGFWQQKQWSWVAAMSWQALKLLIEIVSVLTGGGTMLSLLFAALLVFVLNQTEVRRVFDIPRPENEPSSPSIHTLDVN